MKSKLFQAVVGGILIVSLLGAASASAATEAGNRCGANSSATVLMVSLENGSDSLPATIPSAGVITRWSYTVDLPVPPDSTITGALKVLRPIDVPDQFTVVGEDKPELVGPGTREYSTRIPVQAGDLFAVLAEVPNATGSLICKTDAPGDRVVAVPPTAALGSTVSVVEEFPGYQIPVVVTVEPDVDKDGFGDETQDKCPQDAAVQSTCPSPPPPPVLPVISVIPPLTLSADATAQKGFAKILVTTSQQASVSVIGTATLGKGKAVEINGGTQTVAAGALAKFTLLFPQKLKAKLKQLSRKRSLSLTVVSTAQNASGGPVTSTLKLKLRGQAKPKPRRAAPAKP